MDGLDVQEDDENADQALREQGESITKQSAGSARKSGESESPAAGFLAAALALDPDEQPDSGREREPD